MNGKPVPVESRLADEGHKEKEVEAWIFDGSTEILGDDIAIIGKQVDTRSGPLDLIGVDREGNVVIVELKRDKLPRDAVAQAIDYASDVASWDLERLDEICTRQRGKPLRDYITERLGPGIELSIENIRMLLVGFPRQGDERAERMISWMSEQFDMPINALALGYLKTRSGDELLVRTTSLPEGIDMEKAEEKRWRRTLQPASDAPGTYADDELRELLSKYLSTSSPVPKWIREVLLPAILDQPVFTRDELIKKLIEREEAEDAGAAGTRVTTISTALGRARNDFLRQIVLYDKPEPWSKDNFRLRDERYRSLVDAVLKKINPPSS